MIELVGVEKAFGPVRALRGVSLRVETGQIVGFLGPNGAGKTTALRIAVGVLAADAGSARIDRFDVARERTAAAARVGYLPEGAPLHGDMRVEETLAFRGRLLGLDAAARADAVEKNIERLQLKSVRRRLVSRLSKGYRQRVALAATLMGDPPALLLDEPTSGLDPVQRVEFRELLESLRETHAIVLSSHVLAEVESLADSLIVLASGRVVARGTAQDVCAAAGERDVESAFVKLCREEPG